MPTIIDRQFDSGTALVSYLTENREVTLSTEAENNFRKNLLLSVASYFEKEIVDILVEFAVEKSGDNLLVVSFIKTKALSRQYHTLFDWDVRNANKFFGLFGEEFKASTLKLVNADKTLIQSIKDFMELGSERNRLVHQNFAELT